jgi:HAD superfamily hydrolase (TIGR01459 family)
VLVTGISTNNDAFSTSPPNDSSTSFLMHAAMDDDLMDRYDGFILDQFGVLHNGSHGLDGAPEALQKLFQCGKKLVILSNSSSSSAACQAKLPSLGFDPHHFVGAVTSGQEASDYIQQHYQEPTKALMFTWNASKSSLQFIELCGPQLSMTDDPQEADMIILHGVEVIRGADETKEPLSLGDFYQTGSMECIDPILEVCASRKLPMICCNPDYIMVKPDGSIGHMPGKIAQRYKELFGGSVASFGKPHREHFEACLSKLQLPKHRVAHVGDSLHHDVAGANATGIDSIFITGGVHYQELGADLGMLPSERALQQLFVKHGQTPTHVLPMFRF